MLLDQSRSMKCKSFPLQLRKRLPSSTVEFRSAFFFFPFSSTTPSIHSYLDRLLRRFAYIRDSTKRGPRVTGPQSKGDFRVFRRTTDNLFVARTKGPWKREVRGSTLPRPSSHLLPDTHLPLSSTSYVPNEAARWIDSPPRMRLFLLPSPPLHPSSLLSFFLLRVSADRTGAPFLLLPTSNLCAKTKNSFSYSLSNRFSLPLSLSMSSPPRRSKLRFVPRTG